MPGRTAQYRQKVAGGEVRRWYAYLVEEEVVQRERCDEAAQRRSTGCGRDEMAKLAKSSSSHQQGWPTEF
jgi:hypothetical protein